MRVALMATGGTIASRQTPEGLVASASGAELLDGLGADRVPSGTVVTAFDVGTKGSYALTLDDMAAIARAALAQCADGADGVVVTHGTDSIEETAFLLDLLHEGDQPIVVTGAQLPFDAPDGDGPDNLALALSVAASTPYRGLGALVAFAGQVLPARGVRKVDTTALAAFANPAAPGGRARSTLHSAAEHLHLRSMPDVRVVAAVPGGTGDAVRDAVRRRPEGIVFQALGIGNASAEDAAAVAEAVAAGIPVLVTTRVWHGPVRPLYGRGGGKALEAAGAVFADGLSTWQARVLLSVALSLGPGRSAERVVAEWLGAHPGG